MKLYPTMRQVVRDILILLALLAILAWRFV
jgi:hypothetical protein